MKQTLLIAGTAVLALAAPAFAESLDAVTPSGAIVLAQPPPEAETPPPPPAPNFVWEPGNWSWSGSSFVWVPGKFIERPATTAALAPGHWEQRPDGWLWVPATWEYSATGSTLPPR